MTTQRKTETNRINAKASTGPKTALGKLHTRKNAYRHGLSVSIIANPARSAEVENLALEIAGEGANPNVIELAQRIAEAQIDLVRVRKARHDLLCCEFNDPEFRPNKFFRDARNVLRILSGSMRREGPDAVLPPEVVQYVENVWYRKPQGYGPLRAARAFTTKICCPRF